MGSQVQRRVVVHVTHPRNVIGRAVVEEPFADMQLAHETRVAHRMHAWVCFYVAAQVSLLKALLLQPRSHGFLLGRNEAIVWRGPSSGGAGG